jgi:outer membrane lipoprotein-sorting protein
MERSDGDLYGGDWDRRDTERQEPEWRDAELGEQLRRLEIPEHAPDFFATLEEKLEAEAGSAATRQRGAASSVEKAVTTRQYRTAAKSRHNWLRLAWVPVPVAALIILLLWAFAGPLGLDSFKPQPASAAEITQKVATAAAAAKTLRGTLVIVSPGETGEARDETRWSFVSTAEGDFRLTGLTRAEDLSYDHRAGAQRTVNRGEGGEPVFASEMTGMATGLPDPAPADYVLERQLGAVVRALAGSTEASVEEAIYEGRAVWTLSTDVKVNLLVDTSADHMEVTVDQETGFPVRILETRDGEFVQELHLEGLEIDPELTETIFHLEFPEGAEVIHTEGGFRRIDPAELATEGAAVVGYTPVLPSQVPEGFALTEVAVAEMGQASGKEGMNPPAPGVVSAMYRWGFDRLVVSTRLVGSDASLWSDPMASGEGYIDTPERVVLTAGPFATKTAEVLIDARSVPHLWVMNDTLLLTVSGDLTREELIAVAESLAVVE